MPAQACRHDENVLSIDEIFRLKFINKLRKTTAYYLLPHLYPFCG